jgi:hypothetical protein
MDLGESPFAGKKMVFIDVKPLLNFNCFVRPVTEKLNLFV